MKIDVSLTWVKLRISIYEMWTVIQGMLHFICVLPAYDKHQKKKSQYIWLQLGNKIGGDMESAPEIQFKSKYLQNIIEP